MTSYQDKNILINDNTIKNNKEYINKDTNINLSITLTQNSSPSSKDIIFSPKLSNNLTILDPPISHQESIEKIPQKFIITQNNSNLQSNSLEKKEISLNLFEDSSLKNGFYSKSDLNYLNPIKSQNQIINNNNKLIEPKFHNDFIKDESNMSISKNDFDKKNVRVKFRQSAKFKDRNLFNKFKVFHIKQKNLKEKLSNKHRNKRKYKPDDIRKKIKARFHKSIKNIINENLKQAGSKMFFSFLPQIFISSIARDKNHQVLDLTYREIIQKDFITGVDEKKYKNKSVDLAKYKNNLKVLEYLDKNMDICEKSGFDIISNMKYSDLLDEYFTSKEFQHAIKKLQEENEEEDYIKEYIKKAKNYVKFFSVSPSKINSKNQKNNISNLLTVEIENNKNFSNNK